MTMLDAVLSACLQAAVIRATLDAILNACLSTAVLLHRRDHTGRNVECMLERSSNCIINTHASLKF